MPESRRRPRREATPVPTPDELFHLVFGDEPWVSPEPPPVPLLEASARRADRAASPRRDEPVLPIGQVVLLATVFVLWLAAGIAAWVMGI